MTDTPEERQELAESLKQLRKIRPDLAKHVYAVLIAIKKLQKGRE